MNKLIEAIKHSLPVSTEVMSEYFERLESDLISIAAEWEKERAAFVRMEQRVLELENKLSDVWMRIGDSLDTSIQQVSGHIQQMSGQIGELEQKIDDVRQGDVFRRIEFLQTKILFLENTLQRNLLSDDDQKNNTIYSFMVRMRRLFQRKNVEGISYVRIGRKHDGGYIMADDFDSKRIAYSVGIADDVSWDEDMAARGFDVYMYDHTIEGLPKEDKRFHFHKIGLGNESDDKNPDLKTLTQLIAENGHSEERHMILKIDIEGGEWAVLRDVEEKTLRQFSQIIFEFHDLICPEKEELICTAMEKLNRTHQLVHLHANNFGSYLQLGGIVLPELIEGTYLLKEEYCFCDQKETLPSPLDEPNCVYLPDIFLGAWDS